MPTAITIAQLQQLFPSTPRDTLIAYVPHINVLCDRYQINTPIRMAAFLSQVGHESAGLSRITENLNYSESGLLKVFKKYFTSDTAKEYAYKPEKIANKVYANRMGNGTEESGDGFRFRGKGLLQLTGRNNYTAFAKWCGKNLEQTEAYLNTSEGAVASAIFFWTKNNLNTIADTENVELLTKKINGGVHGLAERRDLYQRAKKIFK